MRIKLMILCGFVASVLAVGCGPTTPTTKPTTPSTKAGDTPATKPVDKPADKPMDKPMDKPADKKDEKPADKKDGGTVIPPVEPKKDEPKK